MRLLLLCLNNISYFNNFASIIKWLIANRPLNIIIIGPAHPYRGGLATYNHRLAQEFIRLEDQVVIHTFTTQYPSIFFPGKTQFSNDQPPKGLQISREISSINPINWIKKGNQIAKLNPDLVICVYWIPFMAPCFGTILRRIRKNGNTRIVGLIHNLLPHEKRPGDRLLSKYFLPPVHGFIVQSQSVFDDLENYGVTSNIKLIPHPIYDNFGERVSKKTSAAKLGLDPNQRYILFFGYIRDYKGLDLLIKAMANSEIRHEKIQLIVAGEFYSNEKEHKQLINGLGIDDLVIMHNLFISNEDVKYYFGLADLVVQPYKTATQSGISQMAYHFEKPMVVTDVGGLAEIVPNEQAGYVCEVDPQAISRAILRFYKEKKSETFIEFIQQKKKEFSWAYMVNAIIEVAQLQSKDKSASAR